MATVKNWEVWCETEQAWVQTWDTSEPTVCPNNNGHTITSSMTKEVSQVSNVPGTYPKGSGVRFRSKCFTDSHLPFEVACVEGKKLLLMVSKCVFDESIQSLPHLVFEVQAYVDTQWVIVDQNFYSTLGDLIVDADEKSKTSNGVWTLDFNWPTLENPIREATILQYGMKIKVYMTLDDKHDPETPYSGYTEITGEQKPTWPDPAPAVEVAHVCFHCVAYDEDEI